MLYHHNKHIQSTLVLFLQAACSKLNSSRYRLENTQRPYRRGSKVVQAAGTLSDRRHLQSNTRLDTFTKQDTWNYTNTHYNGIFVHNFCSLVYYLSTYNSQEAAASSSRETENMVDGVEDELERAGLLYSYWEMERQIHSLYCIQKRGGVLPTLHP